MPSILKTLKIIQNNSYENYLKEPSNKNGLCGTTAKQLRRCLTETSEISSPSTKIRPPEIGLKRNSAFSTLDLPAPVLPTIPT